MGAVTRANVAYTDGMARTKGQRDAMNAATSVNTRIISAFGGIKLIGASGLRVGRREVQAPAMK